MRLVKDVEDSIEAGHPWIYRDAIEPVALAPGSIVRVTNRAGETLAYAYADEGPIALRVVARKQSELADDVVSARLASALAARAPFVDERTDAFRWVHGEADRLPGCIVDLYGAWAVVRFDSPGALGWLAADGVESFAKRLQAIRPSLRGVLVREGRGERKLVRVVSGDPPPQPLEVREHGMALWVDLMHGQKTGLFLDHRESRRRVRALSMGRRVLNLYGYTGGFSVAAGLGGAVEVVTVDVAEAALGLAEASWRANGLDTARHRIHVADVPSFLERAREHGEHFDLIVADPPSFAPSEAAVPAAMKSYRALHRACLRLSSPGGLYLAASCSSHIGLDRFERTLREACAKVSAHVRVFERWGAPGDHPRLPAFPEGDYLKCILLGVDGNRRRTSN